MMQVLLYLFAMYITFLNVQKNTLSLNASLHVIQENLHWSIWTVWFLFSFRLKIPCSRPLHVPNGQAYISSNITSLLTCAIMSFHLHLHNTQKKKDKESNQCRQAHYSQWKWMIGWQLCMLMPGSKLNLKAAGFFWNIMFLCKQKCLDVGSGIKRQRFWQCCVLDLVHCQTFSLNRAKDLCVSVRMSEQLF